MLPYEWTQQASFRWTRIDMLLGLLDEIVRVLKELEASNGEPLKPASVAEEQKWRRAQLLLAALISGVNPELGEVALSCLRLYEFVHRAVVTRQREMLAGARQALETIRSAFEAVRRDAIELERQGVIPPLGSDAGLVCSA